MRKRSGLCEHPFGTIKRAFNQSYLLLKGFRKVRGEIGLTMLACNLRRVLNIMVTRQLVKAVTSCLFSQRRFFNGNNDRNNASR